MGCWWLKCWRALARPWARPWRGDEIRKVLSFPLCHFILQFHSLLSLFLNWLGFAPSLPLMSFFCFRIHPISHILFSCHSSAVFTTLWQFLNLPLCFMILMLLKSQLLCRMPFKLDLSDVFSQLDYYTLRTEIVLYTPQYLILK